MSHKLHAIDCVNPQNGAFVPEFKRLTQSMVTAQLICRLTKLLQEHRGSTMGWLSGQPAFGAQIELLQQSIDRLFVLLEEVARSATGCLSPDELRNLHNDWQTVLMGWRNDQLMHNFEFHSHLIDSLLRLLRLNCQEAFSASWQAGDEQALALLNICFAELPELTELLAQLRGLSTNVAVNKACAEVNRAKISFLIDQSKARHKQLRKVCQQYALGVKMPHGYQSQYERFLRSLQSSIVNAEKICVDSTVVYQSSTKIIDQLWLLVDWHLRAVESDVTSCILRA